MGRRGYFLAFAIAAINAFGIGASSAENTYGVAPDNIKDSLDRLVRSYPDQIAGHDNEFLILKNGLKFRTLGRADQQDIPRVAGKSRYRRHVLFDIPDRRGAKATGHQRRSWPRPL